MNDKRIQSFLKNLEDMPEITEAHMPAKEDLLGHVEEQINATKQAIAASYLEVKKLVVYLSSKDHIAVEYAKSKLTEYAKELRSHKTSLEAWEKVLDDLQKTV